MALQREPTLMDRPHPHARWLHELRNVVNTASIAATVGRELVADDPATAAEMLREAEAALVQCRELLAHSGEHVRQDRSRARPVAAGVRRQAA